MEERDAWRSDALIRALTQYETELRAAGLEETTVTTYVDQSARFLRWLSGRYSPLRTTAS